KAAEINIAVDVQRERVDADVRIVFSYSADGTGGTSNQGHQGKTRLGFGFRLVIDAALLAVVAKNRRRELAAGVAVDAGRVNEEIAGDILRQAQLNVCHASNFPVSSFEFRVSSQLCLNSKP